MSEIADKIRAYVNDTTVSDHYGNWGILRRDQRILIRKLCDTCDMFERAADELARKQSEGEWIFKNSPFEMLDMAFKRLFPDVKYIAYFEPNIRDKPNGDNVCGLTDFADDGEITIFIDCDLSINNAVEIFAHELAHAGVGVGHEHDEVWKKAFDDLFNEYNKLGEEMFSSHINAPKGEDYINDLAKMKGGAE